MAGSVIGSVASGIIGGIGNKKAEKQMRAGAEAAAPIITQASPFGVNTLFGKSKGGEFTTSTPFNHSAGFANDIAYNSGRLAQQSSARGFADRFLEASNRVNDKREGQAFASLESKLFNRAGASTGTQRQIADFRNDIEDRRFGRAVRAEQLGQQMQSSIMNDFFKAIGAQQGLQGSQLDQIGLGLKGSQVFAPYALPGNPAAAQAGAFAAGNTQDFYDSLGSTVGGALNTGISAFGNRPQGIGTGNPFNGTGPQLSFQNRANPFTSLGF